MPVSYLEGPSNERPDVDVHEGCRQNATRACSTVSGEEVKGHIWEKDRLYHDGGGGRLVRGILVLKFVLLFPLGIAGASSNIGAFIERGSMMRGGLERTVFTHSTENHGEMKLVRYVEKAELVCPQELCNQCYDS